MEGRGKYQVLACTVKMKDRVDQVVKAFTFGGQLQIISENDCSKYSLRSSTPVLSLLTQSVESILMDEVQILLAERRETWEEEQP